MKTAPRQTQEEKSRQMRLRLVEATLDCLQERGYHGSSLSQILTRAGVSRGAWRHHYGSKKELMAAAARHFLAGQIRKAEELAGEIEVADAHLSFFMDFIWETFYQGSRRDIWLEFHVACRTDVELRQALALVFQNFFQTLNELWHTHFATTDRTEASVSVLMNLSLCVLRGMGVQSLIVDSREYYQELRAQWVAMLAPLVDIREDTLPARKR